MVDYQIWLAEWFASFTAVAKVMRTVWAWPIAESAHFIGLSLLFGTVGLFDLRLLGVGRRIPIGAMHRLVKWGVLGFAMNVLSGIPFLMTEPDQYLYNQAFQFKLLFLMLAGLNALAFSLTSADLIADPGTAREATRTAKVIAAMSLSLWIGVLIAGRLLTFYRPVLCEPGRAGILATCIPGSSDR